MFSHASATLSIIGLGYLVTAHPCYSVVGTYPTGILTCYFRKNTFYFRKNKWSNKTLILSTTLNNLNVTEQSIKKRSKFDNWQFLVNVELEPWLLCWESSTILKTILLTMNIYTCIFIWRSLFAACTDTHNLMYNLSPFRKLISWSWGDWNKLNLQR